MIIPFENDIVTIKILLKIGERIMSIIFDEKENVFAIHTENTSYAMALVDGTNLHHVYYGERSHATNVRYVLCEGVYPFIPSTAKRETNG